MIISTDAQILACIQEITDFRDDSALDGSDNWKIRLRDEADRLATVLQSIHEKANEPKLSFDYLNAIAGVQIALGYLQNSLFEFEEGNERNGRNQAWQSLSYLCAGIGRVQLAITNEDIAEGVF